MSVAYLSMFVNHAIATDIKFIKQSALISVYTCTHTSDTHNLKYNICIIYYDIMQKENYTHI